MVSRRLFIGAAAAASFAGPVLAAKSKHAAKAPAHAKSLAKSMAANAKPISVEERRERIAKAQRLMGEQGIGALLVESGSTLDYFTGVQWRRSERVTAAVIPAKGEIIVVTPHFEEPSVRETLQVGGDVRPWDEHEDPFALIARSVADRGGAGKPLAIESTTRFYIVDQVRTAGNFQITSGDPVVRPCRMFKSAHELALMQTASDITMAAYARVYPQVKAGMTQHDIAHLMDQATAEFGGGGEGFSLVLLNEAAAYPHGSRQPQTVKEGGVVLMDCGTSVHGYESDISRTWVHGKPSKRQRKVWDTVKRGQEIALETAKLGTPCGDIDRAVRAYYEREGWGPGYKLPGLSHRTGHGIGMDGHESPYLVLSDTTPLAPGMCFSDEPGLYIPGEFGIRLEDCWHMTEQGPKLFSGLAKSLESPI
jgi:Xaa-Pro dipeptidase